MSPVSVVENGAQIAVTVTTGIIPIVFAANAGPPGPPGPWTKMTQAEYDALPQKDEFTLYVIIG